MASELSFNCCPGSRTNPSATGSQAALDVFASEPPPADHPLVGRPDVVCTPHLGASTAEAQEDVSIEVAEVVVSALKVGAPQAGCLP